MKRSVVETILGAGVILIAALFFLYGYKIGNVGTTEGYTIQADFSGIGGLKPGDEVQISGVKVGSVSAIELTKDSYLARVFITIGAEHNIPVDTAATISSQSLLGGRYLELQPGADETYLQDGERIEYTQAPQNLEQLLGKFIFSMQSNDKDSE